LNPIGFIDAWFGDINGGGAAKPHREPGNQRLKDGLDLLAFGEIRIPFFLFCQRRLLA
jgi:hypothetical protein